MCCEVSAVRMVRSAVCPVPCVLQGDEFVIRPGPPPPERSISRDLVWSSRHLPRVDDHGNRRPWCGRRFAAAPVVAELHGGDDLGGLARNGRGERRGSVLGTGIEQRRRREG